MSTSINSHAAKSAHSSLIFDTSQSLRTWITINDGVMGGQSEGRITQPADFMVFSDTINTKGGGFSSIRTHVPAGLYDGISGFKLRVRSDGRTYKLSLRTGVRYKGRQIAFQAPLPITELNIWTDIILDFSTLSPVRFGQPIPNATFEARDIQNVGFIIADGQDGAFRLDIRSIEMIQTL